MDKLERLRKIKELAENGYLGEKAAALEKYNMLKSLYKIADDMISVPAITEHEFKYSRAYERKLLLQIIHMVCGDVDVFRITGKQILIAETTDFEAAEIGLHYEVYAAEIGLHYEVYAAAIKKHMQAAYIAFIQANDIFPNESVRVPDKKNKRYAKVDDDVKRAAVALAAMTDKTFVPRGLLEGA